MKRIFKLAIILVVIGCGSNAMAQKFGHLDSQSLLALMPEREAAKGTLEKKAKELQDALETMQVEYNNKLNSYVEVRDSLGALVRQTKEAELADLQERIQLFQQKAQQDLQKEEANLLKPIYDKFQAALKEVGKENGYIYIFDVNALMYFDETQSVDVTEKLKAKIGVAK